MWFIILGLLIFCATLISIFVYWKYYARMVVLSKKLPGPSALPVIGNGLLFYNKNAVENLQIVCDLCKEYGPVCRVWIGPELFVLLTDPKDSEAILTSPKLIDKSNVYNLIRPWLSDGLLISTGQKWRSRRKILTPAFHFKILEEFVETFDRQSTVLIKKLLRFDKNDRVELFPIVALYALDVICESAMGVSINAQMNTESEYVRAVNIISHVIHLRMFDVWYRTDFFFQFSKIAENQRYAVKVLHDFTDKVINDRRCELIDQAVKNDFNDQEFGIKRKKAFLDVLLEATVDGEPLEDLDIREEVDTFMFEGHDTTTSGITFCLYNLAKNPVAQQKCFREIIEVMGNDKTKPITYNELNQLHYLDKVIRETLRMFPSVPIFGRYVKQEIIINGRTYPAGTNLVIPIYYMGKLESLYDNPEEFRPERFDEDAKAQLQKSHAFAYVPFSAGPRNCIGQKFAMLEMKSVVSKMLRYYKLSLAEDSKVYPTLTAELILRPASSIKFHISSRDS